jgi:hypothetical protein
LVNCGTESKEVAVRVIGDITLVVEDALSIGSGLRSMEYAPNCLEKG